MPVQAPLAMLIPQGWEMMELQPGLSQMRNETATGSASVMVGEAQTQIFHLSSGLWVLPRRLI